MHAVHGSMREGKELLKVPMAEGWIGRRVDKFCVEIRSLQLSCSGIALQQLNAKTLLVFRCKLIELEESSLVD